MRKLIPAYVLYFLVLSATTSWCADPVGVRLQKMSVNIKAGPAQGSGTIIIRKIGEKKTTWVLTAYHVVEDLRHVRTVIDDDGKEKKVVTYDDAQITQEQVENGRVVGEIKFDARVVCVDQRRDIALLRVRKDDLGPSVLGASFYLKDSIPFPGTEIYHCGAPGGQQIGGTQSLTHGIISRIGVRIPKFGGSEHGVFDQSDCAALPGSSGGLVALKSSGEWIGMITLGLSGGDNFHWVVPVRSVKEWADEAGIMWILDPNIKVKDEGNIPLEVNYTRKKNK